jgi:hypothetical protein
VIQKVFVLWARILFIGNQKLKDDDESNFKKYPYRKLDQQIPIFNQLSDEKGHQMHRLWRADLGNAGGCSEGEGI